MKIKNKILINIFLPSLILLFLLTYYFISSENATKLKTFENKIESTNAVMVKVLSEPLWHYYNNWLVSNCEAFFNDEYIYSIRVYNDRGDLLFSDKKDYSVADIYKQAHTLEIIKNGVKTGKIEVVYTKQDIKNSTNRMEFRFFVFISLLIFIIFAMIYFVSKIIYSPVAKIVNGLKKVDNGDFLFRLRLKKNDEFKLIERYFNRMIENLEKTMNENTKYIEDVKDKSTELEAAYNQMISINETLADTLTGLEVSENKYRNIFNYAPDSMFILNLESKKIEEFNREFLNFISKTSFQITDLDITDIFSMNDIEKIFSKIEHRELLYNYETYLELLQKYVIISVIPMEYDFLYVQVVIKDITETKKLQNTLEEYAKNLEEKVEIRTREIIRANKKIKEQQEKLIEDAYNRGLVEVTSGIIHNIGNVVNVIDLNLEELIVQFPKSDVGVRFFKEIVYKKLMEYSKEDKSVEKIALALPRIIETLEEFGDIVKNNFTFLQKKVTHLKEIVQLQKSFIGSLGTEDYNDLNEIISEVLEIYIPSIQKRDITLDFEKHNIPKLLCDKSQIFQLIGNLVKNSYEAIDLKDIEDGKIRIKTYEKEKTIFILIEDNGSGIKQEYLEKIFSFGFTTKQEIRGTGIGLHNSKEILKKYGGNIDVSSELGRGTKFIISIPIERNANDY